MHWLEAVVIRFYSNEERAPLSDWSNMELWYSSSLPQYMRDLSYHGDALDTVRSLDWLVTYALDLEYQDDSARYNLAAHSVGNVASTAPSSPAIPITPLQYLAAVIGVSDLCRNGNAWADVEWAVYHVLSRRYSAAVVREATQNSRGNRRTDDEKSADSIHGDLVAAPDAFPLGFATSSSQLNLFTSLLRVLYVHDIRDCQSSINRLVSALQQVTAAPQTDVSLGQVGR